MEWISWLVLRRLVVGWWLGVLAFKVYRYSNWHWLFLCWAMSKGMMLELIQEFSLHGAFTSSLINHHQRQAIYLANLEYVLRTRFEMLLIWSYLCSWWTGLLIYHRDRFLFIRTITLYPQLLHFIKRKCVCGLSSLNNLLANLTDTHSETRHQQENCSENAIFHWVYI